MPKKYATARQTTLVNGDDRGQPWSHHHESTVPCWNALPSGFSRRHFLAGAGAFAGASMLNLSSLPAQAGILGFVARAAASLLIQTALKYTLTRAWRALSERSQQNRQAMSNMMRTHGFRSQFNHVSGEYRPSINGLDGERYVNEALEPGYGAIGAARDGGINDYEYCAFPNYLYGRTAPLLGRPDIVVMRQVVIEIFEDLGYDERAMTARIFPLKTEEMPDYDDTWQSRYRGVYRTGYGYVITQTLGFHDRIHPKVRIIIRPRRGRTPFYENDIPLPPRTWRYSRYSRW